MKNATDHAQNLLDFINRSQTPFHAVHEMKCFLSAKGFTEINEASAWNLTSNGKYFLTRNDSSLIAFI